MTSKDLSHWAQTIGTVGMLGWMILCRTVPKSQTTVSEATLIIEKDQADKAAQAATLRANHLAWLLAEKNKKP